MTRVLVTDAGRGSAISIIRSLGRRGFDVVAADEDPRSPGFYSRYASERLVYPSPRDAPNAVVEALARAVRARRVDLIIPVTDEVVLPLSAARERFHGVSALALPDHAALARTANKLETLELARELGVPTPRTVLVETVADAVCEAPALGWPIVLKPQSSRVYEGGQAIEAYAVRYASSLAGLEREMGAFEGRCPVLLQEYCGGEAHGVELLLDRGRPVAAFQHRRIREVPLTGGASSFRESVPISRTLLHFSVRLLEALDWTGLAMVEFKIGDDGPRLMEINGRIWGSLPLAVKSGVDFPALLADLVLGYGSGTNGRPLTTYEVGVSSRNLELEIVWIASVLRGTRRYPFLPAPSRLEAAKAAARLFWPADGFDILSRDDPRPGLAEILKIAAKLRDKVSRPTTGS